MCVRELTLMSSPLCFQDTFTWKKLFCGNNLAKFQFLCLLVHTVEACLSTPQRGKMLKACTTYFWIGVKSTDDFSPFAAFWVRVHHVGFHCHVRRVCMQHNAFNSTLRVFSLACCRADCNWKGDNQTLHYYYGRMTTEDIPCSPTCTIATMLGESANSQRTSTLICSVFGEPAPFSAVHMYIPAKTQAVNLRKITE